MTNFPWGNFGTSVIVFWLQNFSDTQIMSDVIDVRCENVDTLKLTPTCEKSNQLPPPQAPSKEMVTDLP